MFPLPNRVNLIVYAGSMATLIQLTNLTKSYGPRVILDRATLTIAEKQKIGVIGRNGAGKSTLFRIIVGDEEADSGEVVIHATARVGYLTQHDSYAPEETVMGFLLRHTGKEAWQCAKVAGKFHLKNELLDAQIGTLPGGYQMRVKLSAMLLAEPNILLLDEPTNYLDLSTLLLLEQFLQTYRGSFLVISHDREFLKNTCDQTLEVDQGKTVLFPRPIEEYLAHKEEQHEMISKFNKKVEREKRHLQDFVDRFGAKATKASQAQSKMKQIAKLKTIDIVHPMSTSRIRIPRVEERKGTALHVQDMTIGYGDKIIAKDISLTIERGEHVAIVGDNGQGKSTFFKTIANSIPSLSGTFRWGPHINVGYYAQHVASALNPLLNVKTSLMHAAPHAKNEEILAMAGNFLFRDDDILKPVSILSGGEKARLCLAILLLQKHQVLLLDEPTNHLDFETVEALARALAECNATVLFISHNRTFVNVLATAVIEVKGGRVKRYHHNYEEYVYYLGQELGKDDVVKESPKKVGAVIATDKEERERLRASLKEEKRALHDVEVDVMELEKEKQKVIGWFEKHAGEFSREKQEHLQAVTELLEKKEKQWMETQERIQVIEARL